MKNVSKCTADRKVFQPRYRVIVEDQKIPESFSSEPRCYGNVEISAEERKVLSLPPKFAVFNRIDTLRCEGEVEKGLAKLRWYKRRE